MDLEKIYELESSFKVTRIKEEAINLLLQIENPIVVEKQEEPIVVEKETEEEG